MYIPHVGLDDPDPTRFSLLERRGHIEDGRMKADTACGSTTIVHSQNTTSCLDQPRPTHRYLDIEIATIAGSWANASHERFLASS